MEVKGLLWSSRKLVSAALGRQHDKETEQMIITLRVECVWGMHLEEDCVRVIEIDERASLLGLHAAIQDSVAFDYDHLFEFFAGRNQRHRKLMFANFVDWEYQADALEEITLKQAYPLPKSCKLYYHFDFGDDWYFEIRKSRRKSVKPEAGAKYPRVVERIGPNPKQYGEYDEE